MFIDKSNYRGAGADQGFEVRGGALKKMRRAEGGAKSFGVFRVKNHDLTQKIIFFPILGGRVPDAPPPHLDPPLGWVHSYLTI